MCKLIAALMQLTASVLESISTTLHGDSLTVYQRQCTYSTSHEYCSLPPSSYRRALNFDLITEDISHRERFVSRDFKCQSVIHLTVYILSCVFITVWPYNRPLGLKTFRPQDNVCQSVLHLTVYILSCVFITVWPHNRPLGLKTFRPQDNDCQPVLHLTVRHSLTSWSSFICFSCTTEKLQFHQKTTLFFIRSFGQRLLSYVHWDQSQVIVRENNIVDWWMIE